MAMDSRNLMRGVAVGVCLVITPIANGARAGLERDAATCSSTQRLGPDDPGGADNFGSHVAVEGDVAVIGAANADGLAGAAYVFERTRAGWIQRAKLVASDASLFAEFGENVRLFNDTILIGAPGDQNGVGAMYVYRRVGRSNALWVEEAKLTATDPTEFSFFADSIALGDDIAVAGADLGTVPEVGTTGTAYVFRRVGVTWTQEAKLVAGDLTVNAGFGSGSAVTPKGDLVAIGAGSALSGDTRPGAVYFFQREGQVWTQQQKFVPNGAPDGEFFGDSNLNFSDDNLLVGAPFALGPSGIQTGAAYVLRRMSDQWIQEARLAPSDTDPRLFGTRLGISGSTIVVGAPFTDFSQPANGGAAYLFRRQGVGNWVQQMKLKAFDATPHDNFGGYVAVDGSTILVGAEDQTAPSGDDEGAAYVYTDCK
jgi:FG-GAP repeat protein